MTRAEAKRMAKSIASTLLYSDLHGSALIDSVAETEGLDEKDKTRLYNAFVDLIAELETAGNKQPAQD